MRKLQQIFPMRLVSPSGDARWPARSPDLRIRDFFRWDYLKEYMFKHQPHTLAELKIRIWEEIAAVPIDICENAVENQNMVSSIGLSLPVTIVLLMSFSKPDFSISYLII